MTKGLRLMMMVPLITAFIGMAITFVVPILQRTLIDDYIRNSNFDARENWFLHFFLIVAAIVGFDILSKVISMVQGRIATIAGNRFTRFLRTLLFEKIQMLSMSSVQKKSTGDLMGRINNDVAVVQNFIRSKHGRAVTAIRDNEIAARASGINVTKYKMIAFVVSAALAGMAGALYGLNYSTVTAAKFKFDTSILVLVFVVLGGIGNIRGSVIAAAALTLLPELLRSFSNYRMLVYAIVLIVVMLFTWSPKMKEVSSVATDKVSRIFKKKEAGTNE